MLDSKILWEPLNNKTIGPFSSPEGLPPERSIDFSTNQVPSLYQQRRGLYRKSVVKLEEARIKAEELLERDSYDLVLALIKCGPPILRVR